MSSVNVDALFQHLMEDPDIIAPEGQRKEDIALAMAEQRARQSRNNEKALNMVKMNTNVDTLVDFLSKAKKEEEFDVGEYHNELMYAVDAMEQIGTKIQDSDTQNVDISPRELQEYNMAFQRLTDALENPNPNYDFNSDAGKRFIRAATKQFLEHNGDDDGRKTRGLMRNVANDLKAAGKFLEDEDQKSLDERYKKDIAATAEKEDTSPKLNAKQRRVVEENKETVDSLEDQLGNIEELMGITPDVTPEEDDPEAQEYAEARKIVQDEHIARNISAIKSNELAGQPLHQNLFNNDRNFSTMETEDAKAFVEEHWGPNGFKYQDRDPEGYAQHQKIKKDSNDRKANEEANQNRKNEEKRLQDAYAYQHNKEGASRPDQDYPREEDDIAHINNFGNAINYANAHEAVDRLEGGPLEGLSATEKLDAILKWHQDNGGKAEDYRDASAEGAKIRGGKLMKKVVEPFVKAHKDVKGKLDAKGVEATDDIQTPEQEAERYHDGLAETKGAIMAGELKGKTDADRDAHQKMREEINSLDKRYDDSKRSLDGELPPAHEDYINPDKDTDGNYIDPRYIDSQDVSGYNEELHDILDKHVDTYNNINTVNSAVAPPLPDRPAVSVSSDHMDQLNAALNSGDQGVFDETLQRIKGQIANDPYIRTHAMRVAQSKAVEEHARAVQDVDKEREAAKAMLARRPRQYGSDEDTSEEAEKAFLGQAGQRRPPEPEESDEETPPSEEETPTGGEETPPSEEVTPTVSETGSSDAFSGLGTPVQNINIPSQTPQEISEDVLTNKENVDEDDVNAHNNEHGTTNGDQIVADAGKKVRMSAQAKKLLTDNGLDHNDERFAGKKVAELRDIMAARDHLKENDIDPDGTEARHINNLEDATAHTQRESEKNAQLAQLNEQLSLFDRGPEAEKTTSTATPQSQQGSAQADDAGTDTETETGTTGAESVDSRQLPLTERPEPQGIGGRPGRSSEEIGERPVGEAGEPVDRQVAEETTEEEEPTEESPRREIPFRPVGDQYRLPESGPPDSRVQSVRGAPTDEEDETPPPEGVDSRQRRMPLDDTAEDAYQRQELMDADRQRAEQQGAAAQADTEVLSDEPTVQDKRDWLEQNHWDPSGVSDDEIHSEYKKQYSKMRTNHQTAQQHLMDNGINVNSPEFNAEHRDANGKLSQHFNLNTAKKHIDNLGKRQHIRDMATVDGEFNEDRYKELLNHHALDDSKATAKALQSHKDNVVQEKLDQKKGLVHGEVTNMDELPDDVSHADAMERMRKIVQLYNDDDDHKAEHGEGLLDPNHDAHLWDMREDAQKKGNLTPEDIHKIADELEEHDDGFNKGDHKEALDSERSEQDADHDNHQEFLHSPDSHAQRASEFDKSGGNQIHVGETDYPGSPDDPKYQQVGHREDQHMDIGNRTGEQSSMRNRNQKTTEQPPHIHGADKDLIAAQKEHHDLLHDTHGHIGEHQKHKDKSEFHHMVHERDGNPVDGELAEEAKALMESSAEGISRTTKRMKELEEQHPQLADPHYKAEALGRKMHDTDHTTDEHLEHLGIKGEGGLDEEAMRLKQGRPPGPPPRPGLVWAKGIHKWVKPETLQGLTGQVPPGGGTYMPNGISNDHPDEGSDAHAANASGPVMVTANGIHSVNPGGGTSAAGDVNTAKDNVANIFGGMVDSHHKESEASGEPLADQIPIDRNTMDMAGANGPDVQGRAEPETADTEEAQKPPPVQPDDAPEIFGEGATSAGKAFDRAGTAKSAAHRFFEGVKNVAAEAWAEAPDIYGGGMVRGSNRYQKIQARQKMREDKKADSAVKRLAENISEVSQEPEFKKPAEPDREDERQKHIQSIIDMTHGKGRVQGSDKATRYRKLLNEKGVDALKKKKENMEMSHLEREARKTQK